MSLEKAGGGFHALDACECSSYGIDDDGSFKAICLVKESCLLLVAKSLPHLVTRKSGQFCSDSTAPIGDLLAFVPFSCCSRTNITRLITSQVPAPRGRKAVSPRKGSTSGESRKSFSSMLPRALCSHVYTLLLVFSYASLFHLCSHVLLVFSVSVPVILFLEVVG